MSDNSRLNKLKEELIGPVKEKRSENVVEQVRPKNKGKKGKNNEGDKKDTKETSTTKRIWAQKGNINRPIHGFNRRGKK